MVSKGLRAGLLVAAMLGGVCRGQNAVQPGFFARWADFYRTDWKTPGPVDPNAPVAAPAARRGLPQPLDSPPFPSSDWSYGGSPTIGEADGNSYPLMTAINGAKS